MPPILLWKFPITSYSPQQISCTKASAIYEDENTRIERILPALKNAIFYGIRELISDSRTTPDGGIMWTVSGTDGSLREALALLIEEKGELGEDGCDASTQASFSMLRYWAQSNVRQFLFPQIIH
jgi:hypothetical protein